MADISSYERQYTKRRSAASSGDRDDHKTGYGQSNFRGPSVKTNKKGNPNSSPWTGGADRGADYTRTSSNKQGIGPKQPSATRVTPLYSGNKDRSGN